MGSGGILKPKVKEAATGGSTSAGNIASISNPLAGAAGLQRRPSIFGYIEKTGPVKRKKKKKRTKPVENLKKR